MQTEIQFLIDLLLNQKLSPAVRQLCVARIGEVEQLYGATRNAPKTVQPISFDAGAAPPIQQAPSTLALLEKHAQEAAPAPRIIPPQQRIVGGEVSTGAGTRGPRKF